MAAPQLLANPDIDFDQCWATLRSGDFKTQAGVNTLLFGGRKYTLHRDRPVPVPRALVNLWMGDPELRDHPTDSSKSYRADRLRPLAQKWGLDPGGDLSAFPDILVQSFEGEELTTIISDPFGESLEAPDENAITAEQLVAAQRALAKQMASVLAMAEEAGVDIEEMNLGIGSAPPAPPAVPAPPRLPDSKLPDPDADGAALAPLVDPAGSLPLPEPRDPSVPRAKKKVPAKAKAGGGAIVG